ncbi:putative RNA helicase [Helianthus annuus]|uniref:RNA helicase n=1 Tax=Helianthus annuus TaxID=4232 RepID=A0A251RKW9_HELAN|nr:DEAD-box ATP-dependent RNA helicase 58, chloroplastic isoform X1 [Helianthus annuus]KAF5773523.1 putative RNA helicase [Helianthus annuus]KAJ0481366.1 putative RNA helicase [Helianthus annuus]KAJ0849354.1 putative RNA helicase [Helianthus annuus]KAJ0858351.1 putative RNA helicase [Helianthus annuus]
MVVFLSSLTVPFTPPFNKRSHHPISVSVSSSSSPSTNQENPNFVAHQNVTLRDICQAHVPHHILRRVEEVGYLTPTEIQRQALPVLFSRRDCILHAQTGSGKTLAYLLLIYSVVNTQRSSVQALIVVPTRELGMQVAKVARMLAAKADQPELENKACTIMALLDGGTLKRQKSWLKAEPPTIIVGTLGSLCQMLEKQMIKLESMRVLVIDEVDFMFNSSSQVSSLRKLLISYSSINNRQTIFASASIPQHRRFLYDCIQQKWTKADVVHIHANPVQPMPARLQHRFLICSRNERHSALLSLLQSDAPQSAIIFVNEQSEKSKKAGNAPATSVVIDVLKNSHKGSHEILLLEEKLNFNSRAASFSELRQGGSYLLVATDIAGRGVDLPDTTHIYNFDLPKDAVHYLHRAGRTGRKPFSENKCVVTSIITSEERFVLQRYENELMFVCDELFL